MGSGCFFDRGLLLSSPPIPTRTISAAMPSRSVLATVMAGAACTYGLVALLLVAGVLELAVWTQDPKKEVGNFGDPLGLSNIFGYSEDMRAKELNNGRFAMFAAIGILSAELLTGKVGLSQFS